LGLGIVLLGLRMKNLGIFKKRGAAIENKKSPPFHLKPTPLLENKE